MENEERKLRRVGFTLGTMIMVFVVIAVIGIVLLLVL